MHSREQNVLQTSCTKSWKLHAAQCIINQLYEEWEVTCTAQCKMYNRPVVQKVGSYMHHSASQTNCMKSGKLLVHFDGLNLNRRLPCGIPCPSPKPAVDRTYYVACCYDHCFLLLCTLPLGSRVFYLICL